MIVDVPKAPLSFLDAATIQVSVVRPDESVVERASVAVSDDVLDVDFHEEDLTLPGRYVGQVSCWVEGAVSIFGPAFTFEVSPS